MRKKLEYILCDQLPALYSAFNLLVIARFGYHRKPKINNDKYHLYLFGLILN